jgi:type I site-specific restriction-modification system R (restriction) subunit
LLITATSPKREAWRNVYEVTEEFYVHNGRHGTREDVVFLINGIPVLVIECKNASKDEAIALAVDQLRRYHAETPEVMVPEMIFTRHGGYRLRLRGDVEHGAAEHFQLEARGGRQP